MMKKLIFLTSFILLIHSTFAGRFYNPEFGRWLNRDPIGVNGGINIYNSVSNNMVNRFSGGMSFSGGMEKYVEELIENLKIDAWGFEDQEIKDIKKALKNELKDNILKMLKLGNYADENDVIANYLHGSFHLKKGSKSEYNSRKLDINGNYSPGNDFRFIQTDREILEYGAKWGLNDKGEYSLIGNLIKGTSANSVSVNPENVKDNECKLWAHIHPVGSTWGINPATEWYSTFEFLWHNKKKPHINRLESFLTLQILPVC